MPRLIFSALLGAGLAGCATLGGKTPQDKRRSILKMRDRTLEDLYEVNPNAKRAVRSSPGYAVFSNANVNILFASFGGGYGVVTDRKSGKNTFMKMGEVGVGFGLGVKDFRAIFVFHDRRTMKRFIDTGWEFGGHVDAAAKVGDKGAAVGGELLLDGITIYQMTKSGLALQATVKGTKYWKDRKLNRQDY